MENLKSINRRIAGVIVTFSFLLLTGCIKETYNLDQVSGKAQLTPSLAFPLLNGKMTLREMVKSVDTLVFDQDRFVRFIYKKDSAVNLIVQDFYDFTNMVSFTDNYQLGDLAINPFQVQVGYTLDQIRTKLGEPYYTAFGNLNGTTEAFPLFPSVNLGIISFPAITNVEQALFSSGFLVVSVRNDLTTPLKPVTLRLSNIYDNSPIGNEVVLGTIPVGATSSDSINLAGVTVRNLISAVVVLSGSDGNSNPQPIDLQNNKIQIIFNGRNLRVSSGRVIIPPNELHASSGQETITFNPGSGVEIDEFKIIQGNMSFRIQKPSGLTSSLSIELPGTLRNGASISQTMNLGNGTSFNSSVSFDNTVSFLGTIADHPFNLMPYKMHISSSAMVDFSSTDVIRLDLELRNPEFDYLKGYFGQEENIIEPQTVNLGIDDILSTLSGEIFITDPLIKINYRNSFAIPAKIDFQGTGIRSDDSVSLGLEPFTLLYPSDFPANRDISGSKILNKDNTNLPQVISMLPEEINFAGSVKLNPEGDPDRLRNNYIFGNSRILGNVEIELPLEFRIHLQFSDTLDNFLEDIFGEGDVFNWDHINSAGIDFTVKNQFPIGLELQMEMYDSLRNTVLYTVDASEIIGSAPVNLQGESTGFAETSTRITLEKDFFSSVREADKIILNFRINTTGTSDNVKLYSDYLINYKASLVINANVNLE